MAIATVSNTGGNWSSTQSWVSGSIPGVSDSIVFSTSSGPLTINTPSVCGSIDFTNYKSTINFGATLSVTPTSNITSITLDSGFTQSGNYGLALGLSFNTTIRSNNTIWTRKLKIVNNFSTNTVVDVTLYDDWFVYNSGNISGATNSISAIGDLDITNNGSFYIRFLNHNFNVRGSLTMNVYAIGTTTWNINGNCFFSTGNYGIGSPLIISATSSTVTLGIYLGLISVVISGTTYTASFTHTSGTIDTTYHNGLYIYNSTALGGTFNIPYSDAGIYWKFFVFGSGVAQTSNITLTLNSNLTCNDLFIETGYNATILGTGSIYTKTMNIVQNDATSLTLKSGNTYYVGNTSSVGYISSPNCNPNARAVLKSSTPGSKAKLAIYYNTFCYVGNLNIQDIDCSGGRTLNVFNGTYSNCTNVRTFIDLPNTGF